MTQTEALKLALEALETVRHKIDSYQVNVCDDVDEAITTIKEALAEPEIPMQNNNPGLEWDKIPKSFDDWWDSDYDPTGNPFQHETPAYWAWAGWKASSVAINDTSQERVDETAKQRHEAQPEHSCVACEGNPKGNNNPCAVCGMAQPDVDRRSTESKETFDQQEPVAWETFALKFANGKQLSYEKPKDLPKYLDCRPLYTTPPHCKPLSDVEIWNTYKNLWMFHPAEEPRLAGDVLKFARAIEQAHGIKE